MAAVRYRPLLDHFLEVVPLVLYKSNTPCSKNTAIAAECIRIKFIEKTIDLVVTSREVFL